jgi:hypothetical protein
VDDFTATAAVPKAGQDYRKPGQSAEPARNQRTVRGNGRPTVFLRRLYVLFFIEHGTRCVHLAAAPPTPLARG